MKIVVLGGGATGRLVKMLVPQAIVFEGSPKPQLTRNFGCNYLWERIPGIESHPGHVITTVDGLAPSTEAIVKYKCLIGKPHDVDTWDKQKALLEGQFRHEQACHFVKRFPAPQMNLGYLAEVVDPFKKQVTFIGNNSQHTESYDLLVSTIPLHLFVGLSPEFKSLAFDCRTLFDHKPIYVNVETVSEEYVDRIRVDYRTEGFVYRTTTHGSEKHSESLEPFTGWHKLSPGKIYSHGNLPDLIDSFRAWGIHTFGRFGAWQPDELLHQTYKDIKQWANKIGT